MTTPITARELDRRSNDGIHVQLLWCERDGRLWVSVADSKGDRFSIDVRDRSAALDVFNHPLGYAARYGVDTGRATGDSAPAMAQPL